MIWLALSAAYIGVSIVVGARAAMAMAYDVYGTSSKPEQEDYFIGAVVGLFWPVVVPLWVLSKGVTRLVDWMMRKEAK